MLEIFENIVDFDSFKATEYSQEKIDLKIQLTESEKLDAIACECTSIDFYNDDELGLPEVIEIELSDLIGTCRNDNHNNWYELMHGLNKKRHFDLFTSKEELNLRINVKSDDMPDVIEINGKYYINSNGRHRLTIAKCLGIKTALVMVRRLK